MDTKRKYESALADALAALRRGEVILYPTDTVWGIGCDSRNSEAVRRIYSLKQRSDSKAMITLVDSEKSIFNHSSATSLPDFSTDSHPTTIVVSDARGFAPELVGCDGTIAMRVTAEPFSHDLCRRFGHPIVSTSANMSGSPTPLCFNEISDDILDGVDHIVDWRREETATGTPSRVVKLEADGTLKVLRP